jgi:hypothetical protein
MHSLITPATAGLFTTLTTAAPAEGPKINAALSPQQIPIYAHVHNKCTFSIFVFRTVQARCDTNPTTPVHAIRPGEQYTVSKAAYDNDCGMVVKVSRTSAMDPIYHAEYVVHSDRSIWYNFSHEGMGNRRPFTDVARWMTVHGEGDKCKPLYCAAGDNGDDCDYRDRDPSNPKDVDAFINSCKEAADVWVDMC